MKDIKTILYKVLFLISFLILLFIVVSKLYVILNHNNQIINRKVYFHNTDLYDIYDDNPVNLSDLLVDKKKIIVLLDANCPLCVFECYNWIDFSKKIKSNCYSIVFIITADRKEQFTDNFNGKIDNAFYLWDKNHKFIEFNKFLINDSFTQVFLLNRENKIIINGSPIYSKLTEKEYIKNIKGELED